MGWRPRCQSSSAPDLKGSLCGPAVAWKTEEGQVLNHCCPFTLRVVFPDSVDGARKYVCFCMLGDHGLSLLPSVRLLYPPAENESRKATEHAVMWAIGGLSPCLTLAQMVSEWASHALGKYLHLLFNENFDGQDMDMSAQVTAETLLTE